MTKILKNKMFRRWFSVLLAFLLVVTLAPSFQAFGTDEDGKTDIAAQEEGSDLTVSGAPEDTTGGSLPEVTDDVPADPATGGTSSEDEEGIAVAAEDEDISAQTEFWTDPDSSTPSATITSGKIESRNLVLASNKTYTLTVNGTLKGHITVPANTTLNLKGTGTIEGTGQGSVIVVNGNNATLVLNSDTAEKASGIGLTITKGTGSAYVDKDGGNGIFAGAQKNVGGGILVKRTKATDVAKLVLHNGTIRDNTAEAGGGIFIDRNCRFEMHNGAVLNNTATAHEGGGIFMAGGKNRSSATDYSDSKDKTAFINKGKINDNKTQTTNDWGGGGIFIESKGNLRVGNLIVTNNTAQGLGGGISGCPHAKMGIGEITGGAAIYGNEAYKTARLTGALYDMGAGSKTGDIIAYEKDKEGFTADKAKDFYCTKASIVFGTTATWTGRVAYYDKKAEFNNNFGADVSIAKDQKYAVEGASLGLTATPVNVPDPNKVDVQIMNNRSSTHGGGIGCNGNLTIGTLGNKEEIKDGWSIELKKLFKDNAGNMTSIASGAYAFELYDAAQNGGIPADTAKPLATVTNDSSGTVVFNLKGYSAGKHTFYAKEVMPNNADEFVDYDTAWRKIEVEVKEQKTSATVFPDTVTITTRFVPDGGVKYFVQNDQGQFVQSVADGKSGNTIVNKVKPKYQNKLSGSAEFEFTKIYKDGNGNNTVLGSTSDAIDKEFTFELYGSKTVNNEVVPDEGTGALAVAQNDANGKISFKLVHSTEADANKLDNEVILNLYSGITDPNTADPDAIKNSGNQTYTFFAKEVVTDKDKANNQQTTFDESFHRVDIEFDVVQLEEKNISTGADTLLKPVFETEYVANPTVSFGGNNGEEQNIVNIYHPEGEFALKAQKNYYGAADAVDATGKFHFSMISVNAPENGRLVLTDDDVENAKNGVFANNTATVEFPTITYKDLNGQGTSDRGDHWYMISETRSEIDGVQIDPRRYVVKVNVGVADDGMSLTSEITEAYYAEGVTENTGLLGDITRSLELTQIYAKGEGATLPTFAFNNFDTSQSMSVAGYSVNAASNEPLEEVCFVDPKIVKNLEGRTLKADEFNFKLIHLNKDDNVSDDAVNWSSTEGPVISETSNDRYGMVDFDAANNVSGDWENPSCLSYTQPGIYHYRVVEANDTVDPSIDYSKQIITFTAVIEYNAQGQLECTDMYYGYVDGNGYHRYTSKADDPTYEASDNWHPTMTNTAKTMTLKVQKTSALDRNRGLEGATYGLYAVNEGVQDDILIGEETSDKEGWITFENLSLNTAATYYFKERYAPAGHTVSEFRSPYFKVSQGADGYKVITIEDNAQAPSEDEGIRAMAEDDAAASANDEGITIFAEGVYDEATLVEFAKLDARTHEWVEGADLSIINKSTGEVVNRWTSGKANERLEGVLNVDTTYILRENAAPEGYAKADDVEFTIDQYGSVRVISGTGNNSAGLANAVLQDSTISLYDTMLDAEQVVTETRETPGQDDGSFLAKTGDFLKVAGIAALAVIALLGLIYAARRARGHQD